MIKHDYKPQSNKKLLEKPLQIKIPEWLTHPYLIIATATAVLSLAIVLSFPDSKEEVPASIDALGEAIQLDLIQQETTQQSSQNTAYSEPIDIQLEIKSNVEPLSSDLPIISESSWKSEAVKKGDNLSKIFKRIGLSPQQLYQVINLDDNTKLLRNLRPGEAISYQLDDSKKIIALKYAMSIEKTLYIESTNIKPNSEESKQTQLTSRIENKTIEYQVAYSEGVINDSLSAAGKKADLTDTQIANLANIFDWDIDFHLDIRKGDSFSMLYQEKFLEGENIGKGEILAAEVINQGKSYRAVRYVDSKGRISYYTPEGLSMQKAFLRAPIKYSYISSGFKLRRFHPIQKRWKAHRGTDYRAKTGTPIRAAGDGKVTQSSYNKYNGKYIFIQHGQGIVTKYLHMSKRAVSRGKRVKQGQVIGYVGTTGMSEAPHLHYEFLVNGVHRNPRTVSLPKAKPIAKSEKARFTIETTPWITQLTSRNSLSTISHAAAK
jgi:murein DD-endopeptidase MepM/ murein hydrolase activator NlpD